MTNSYSLQQCRELADSLRYDNICEGDDGFIEPLTAQWVFDDSYDPALFLTLMGESHEWKAWMDEEIETLTDIRGAAYFEDLANNPIREPIVITLIGSTPYIWDGWHRIAAAIVNNKGTLPVIYAIIE